MATVTYSQRLGAISDAQLDAAARRLNVGRFIAATPIDRGLFGQNLFLSTTEGEFVLRGAPHWVNGGPNEQWQFSKEMYFAELLHEHTNVPVPWPQRYDSTSDIFGWPYVIVPRLAGISLDDRSARRSLAPCDQLALARALGRGLARLQGLHWPVSGDVDPTCSFSAYPEGFERHIAAELVLMQGMTHGHGALTAPDERWIETAIGAACAERTATVVPTFVHADYKLDNLVLDHTDTGWEVCGVFDLHTACFGDGAYDLCRTACAYLDRDADLARAFVGAWRDTTDTPAIDRARLRLYLTSERMKIWEYFTRPEHRAEWTLSTTFAGFVSRYAEGFERLFV